jgi:hypothetical protein
MFASTVSTFGNTCAQVFLNDLDWVQSFPLGCKGNAHTCLDLFFPENGIPNFMIMDDAKDIVGGKFQEKCRHAGCYSKVIKFGIKVPNAIAKARQLDKKGDSYWEKLVEKEMKNVCIAFDILDNEQNLPVGYLQIPCRLLFDIKLNFTRKTRLVARDTLLIHPQSALLTPVSSHMNW